jgi:hypothetical protein
MGGIAWFLPEEQPGFIGLGVLKYRSLVTGYMEGLG